LRSCWEVARRPDQSHPYSTPATVPRTVPAARLSPKLALSVITKILPDHISLIRAKTWMPSMGTVRALLPAHKFEGSKGQARLILKQVFLDLDDSN
jgi:hypothetical protein